MASSPVRKLFFVLLTLLVTAHIFAESLAIMDISDKTSKVHPDVVRESKSYLSQLLGKLGRYTIIPDKQLQDLQKRSKDWAGCTQMECQLEIGRALQADIVVIPTIDYFGGIFTLTVNYIYIDGKRKTEAGAVDFNGTAAGMKQALEAVVLMIHGKKTETPVLVEKNEALEKYKAENFKAENEKTYVVPVEAAPVAAAPAVIPGSIEFSSSKSGVYVIVDVSSNDKKECTAPCRIEGLEPGVHTIRYELAGHNTKDESVNLKNGENVKRTISLTPVVKSLEEVNNDLIAAVQARDGDQIKSLLAKGANVNYHNKQGISPLLLAILTGYNEMVGYLAGRGAKLTSVESKSLMMIAVDKNDTWLATLTAKQRDTLNITFDDGRTALWHAAMKNSWDVFDIFLKAGTSIEVRDKNSQTIFLWAVETGNTEVITRLAGAGVLRTSKDVDLMLKQAVTNEDYPKVKSLAALRPNVNTVYEDGLTLLWYASVKSRADIAGELLKAGANPRVADPSGKSLLNYCVSTRRYDIAKLLGKYGATLKNEEATFLLQRGLVIGDEELVQLLAGDLKVNVNNRFKDGLSAIWIAAFTNNTKMVEILAKNGANLNLKDNKGRTALFWAVENDKKEIANALITRGADVNAMDNQRRTALLYAVFVDKPRMVHMLVKNGAKVDLRDNEGNSPLVIATSRGNIGLVKLFLENSASVDPADMFGNTPLLIALYKNFDDIAEFLLERSADINHANTKGETPLIVVAGKGKIRQVKMLVEKGAQIDAQDKNGDSALIHAKRENRRDVVFFLLSKDALIEKRSEQDEMMAFGTLNNYHDITENLIQRGISVNRRFSDGLFPLWYAVRNGDNKMIQLLLAAKADLEAKDKNGETVLLYACAKREEYVVVELLNRGANFNITDKQKSTPLMIVSGRGFEKAVQILISKNADLNAKDDKGRTAIIRAQFTGNYQIVDMLRRAGAYE